MTQSTSTRSAPPLPSPKERRRLREARSMSESQVAEVLGVTRATVRSWETGRASPRGRKREAYLKLLKAHEAAASPPRPTHRSPPKAKARPAATAAPDTSAPQEPEREEPREEPGQERPPKPEQQQSRGPEQPPEPEAGEAGQPAPSGAQEQAGTEEPDEAEAPEQAGTEEPDEAETQEQAGTEEPAQEQTSAEEPGDDPAQEEPAQEAERAEPAASHSVPQARKAARPGTPAGASDALYGCAAPVLASHSVPQGRKAVRPGTPADAFDALYGCAAPVLVQQAFLLTGRRRLAREAVEHAFHHAWERWPRVTVDPDPAGWVRAAAHEYAMSPWHRIRPAHRHPDPPTTDRAARELRGAVLDLPPPYRRALLLYDGLGLDLPDTAAELEASTTAAGYRVLHARAAVAERIPELSDPEALHERLAGLLAHGPTMVLATARTVRTRSERRARGRTRTAFGLTAVIIGATAFTLTTAPTRYVPPLAPGVAIGGVPVLSGPQRLTPQDEHLRDALRARPFTGPPRLLPDTR
ncbi:sigma factor-like helix-turn-helix DNA-binding protein [Streptomyces sp. NPDC013953]|uniref:sigma factor-like helix-turn-helix DNA-binding protein n=1 Tax=Streptomyces sp. NPDC013953 TaxID=3364868 RepID=UPI003700E197